MSSTINRYGPFVAEQLEPRVDDWADEIGPGLLASTEFWLGGALSIGVWALLFAAISALTS